MRRWVLSALVGASALLIWTNSNANETITYATGGSFENPTNILARARYASASVSSGESHKEVTERLHRTA
jgi:hypothetical protein